MPQMGITSIRHADSEGFILPVAVHNYVHNLCNLGRNGEGLVETLVFAMRKATQNTEKGKCRVETCY